MMYKKKQYIITFLRYGAGQVDPGTGKVKKRKKWRASVIMTWDESLMPMR